MDPGSCRLSAVCDVSVLVSHEAGSRVADVVPDVTCRRKPETFSPWASPFEEENLSQKTSSSYPPVSLARTEFLPIVETIADQGLELP